MKDGEKCALMLLKSGAGPNLVTDDGQTPVHVAAKHGNLQTMLLLLADGGDPQFKNKVCKQCVLFYKQAVQDKDEQRKRRKVFHLYKDCVERASHISFNRL